MAYTQTDGACRYTSLHYVSCVSLIYYISLNKGVHRIFFIMAKTLNRSVTYDFI